MQPGWCTVGACLPEFVIPSARGKSVKMLHGGVAVWNFCCAAENLSSKRNCCEESRLAQVAGGLDDLLGSCYLPIEMDMHKKGF